MFRPARGVPEGGLLGAMQSTQDGANSWVERIVGRGWGKLNLHSASALIDQGQSSVNLVAAIPSLHAALTMAVAAFLWNRVSRKWQPLLVAYVLVMAFTLVYTAEHYVIDILLGWVLAAMVLVVIRCFESWRRRAADAEDQLNSVSPGGVRAR
jgi:membrane-associated phospholipid phosphatase